jgi:hypothetical protein
MPFNVKFIEALKLDQILGKGKKKPRKISLLT